MKFKQISEEELRDVYLMTNLKEMTEEDREKYLLKYYLYRKLFTEYIMQKLNLKEYDEEIANSGLDFIANNEKEMDIYQYFSSEELKYFYIRNNIYIEKLDKDEEALLQEKIENKNYDLDEKSKKMIEETYQKVTFEDVLRNGKQCMTNYGPDSSSFMAPNDAIVLGIRYNEFAENGLSDKEWDELHDKQLSYLVELIKKMIEELKEKLQNPIAILKYTEFSIRKI